MSQPPALIDAALVTGAVGYRLRRAHFRFVEAWQRRFSALGLPIAPMQGGMLVLIGANPGISQRELMRVLGVEGSTMVQAIARLAALGLIARRRSAEDRRRFALRLTPRGEQARALIMAHLKAHEEAVLAGFTAEERETLRHLLGRICGL